VRITRILAIVLGLTALLAMTAVASASAALPEQSPAEGTFEVSSKAGTFETVGKEKVECTGAKGSGKLTGAKTDTSKVTFEGCKAKDIISVSCSTKGAKSGDIETEIDSELVWKSKAKEEVLEKLTLAKEVEIECTSLVKIKVKGTTLCPVSPVNKKTKTVTLACTQSGGKQNPEEYENEKGEKVKAITESSKNGGKFEQSGLQSEETLTLSTEGEIKA